MNNENANRRKIARNINSSIRIFGIRMKTFFQVCLPGYGIIFLLLRFAVSITGWDDRYIMVGILVVLLFTYAMMDNQFHEPNYIRFINRMFSRIRGDIYKEREVPKNECERIIRYRSDKDERKV